MGNEFWAAVWGAVVGGAIGLAGQVIALLMHAKNRADDAFDVKSGRGISLLFKVLKIYNDFFHLNEYVEESFANASHLHPEARPWQFFRPLANKIDRVEFVAEEFAFVLGLKEDGLLKELLGIDEIHNSTADLFSIVGALRSALASEMPATVDGMVGHTVLTKDQLLHFSPRMAEIDDIVLALPARCEKDLRQARRALIGLHAALLRNGISVPHHLSISPE